MNYSVLKRMIFLLGIVLFLFSFSACRTTGGGVGVEWGQGADNGHHHEVKKAKKEGRHPMHRHMDIGQNINIGIILPVAFTMTLIDNYIFTLKGLTGGLPHRYLILFNWEDLVAM